MSPSDSTVLFRALPRSTVLSSADRRSIRQFAAKVSRDILSGSSFSCLLTSDTELRVLNRKYLNCDYPTDVLSFPSLDSSDSMGDLAISVERAEAQGEEFGHGRLNEICVLILHGALHLAGFDHESDSGEMAGAEERWRSHFALPTALIQRTETCAAPARERVPR